MKTTDILADAIEHSWGKSPKQKAHEKEYNAEYYRKNKEKWKKYRKDVAEYQYNNLMSARLDDLSSMHLGDKGFRKLAQENRREALDRLRKSKTLDREKLETARWYDRYADEAARQAPAEAMALNEMAKLDAQAKKKAEEYAKKEKKQQFKEDVHNKITDIQSSIEVYVTDPIAKATKKAYDAGKNFIDNLFKR